MLSFATWVTNLQGKGYLYLSQKTVITLGVLLTVEKYEVL